ncbi:type II CAAX prenyl endopeptidase Rce1 family protein [Roseivirga pacifica]|uniref:CPBP family glutamic-type intramembrane protease n=1 Tax=Roseivirga pacifica TaxID=1267423 RepID=UPI003B8A8CE5
MSVILAPILETIIFQFAIIETIQFTFERLNRVRIVSILVSGLLFGLSHSYNLYYISIMIGIGIYFAWVYTFISDWKSKKTAFWSITFIHGLNNLTGFIVDDLIGL